MGIVLREGKRWRISLNVPELRYRYRLSEAMLRWLATYDRETGILPTTYMANGRIRQVMESTMQNCMKLGLVYRKPSGRYVIKRRGLARVEIGG
jgi:hypothetical protein